MAQNTCACGCGTPTNGKWARGHSSRGEASRRVVPMPSPRDLDDGVIVDVGELIPDDPDPLAPGGGAPSAAAEPVGASPPQEETGSAPPDDDDAPAHSRRDWQKSAKTPKGRAPRLTVAATKDIRAKVEFALTVPGSIWQARDPLCGGTFVQQIPDTADALTDIICDSPDLVRFFTGPGGSFMKVIKLGAALMPVIQTVAAHHVYHSIELVPEDEAQPQATYAA